MRVFEAFTALRHPKYRRVWTGGVLFQIGFWMQVTGRAALVYKVTGSTAALGTIYFVTYLPQLALSQFAGLVADRFDRRRILMAGQTIGIGTALTMVWLSSNDDASVVAIGAVSFVAGVVQTAMGPAQQALVPSLVPRSELTSAVTLNSATNAASRVFGPLLAGVVNEAFGIPALFWANVIGFTIILSIWIRTPVARQAPMEQANPLAAIANGFRFVRRTRALQVCLLTTLVIGGIGNVYQPLGIPFATEVLADGAKVKGTTYYTYLQATLGGGAFLGILGMADFAKRRPATGMVVSATVMSLALLTLGAMSGLGPVLAVAFVMGAAHFATNTLSMSIIQHVTPDHMRGRVLALYSLCFIGTLPLISLIGGWVAEVFSIRTAMTGAAVVCLTYCVPLVRASRHLPATGAAEPDEGVGDEALAVAARPAEGAPAVS